jgi:hypothetical protein
MITSVQIVANNPNKATVITDTGIVYVDHLFWITTSKLGRLFTLLHEQGHLANDSDDELAADSFAKEQMLSLGYSNKQVLQAANEVFARAPGTHFRLERLRESASHVFPVAAIPFIGDVVGDLVGLIGRGKREKAAHQAALDRQEANNQTAEDIAILEARARQERLKSTLKIVGLVAVLIAGVAIMYFILKSDKPQPKKLIFPQLPKGYQLPTPTHPQLT